MAANAPLTFFSYCREDSEFALRLAEDLKAAGAAVWIDQLDINPGSPWDDAVDNALLNCPRMLVILSPVSVKSNNVRDEISFALSKQKRSSRFSIAIAKRRFVFAVCSTLIFALTTNVDSRLSLRP